jgi:hypothetical protein
VQAFGRMRRRIIRQRSRAPIPEGYRAEFPATATAFERFLARAALRPSGQSAPIGVVVVPWVATPLPWYAIALALALRERDRPTTLIWDDTDLAQPGVPTLREQNAVVGRVLERVEHDIPVVRLSEEERHPARPDDEAHVERLARLNEAWHLRGGRPGPAALARRSVVEANLADTLARIRSLLARQRFEYLIVGGGIWGSGGLFPLAGREAGIRVSTYDAGEGWVQSSNRGVAAQQADVGAAFRALWRDDLVGIDPWIRAGRDEFTSRLAARDRGQFQVVGAGAPLEFPADVVIPLNVDFDAAALGRHAHFVDTTEWVTETVAFALAHSNAHVVVRQHPSERRARERSRLDLRAHLHQRFGPEPRLHFVGAEEPTSTYDLIERARLVIPFVSTIGIEAAALGRPVVVAGPSYYSDLGFVYEPGSRVEYFSLLARGLAGELTPMVHQAERAWLCYYLSQCCNRVWTDFTPQPVDFWKWSDRPPNVVFDEPEVADLITSIDRDVPLALVRHRRFVAATASPSADR